MESLSLFSPLVSMLCGEEGIILTVIKVLICTSTLRGILQLPAEGL